MSKYARVPILNDQTNASTEPVWTFIIETRDFFLSAPFRRSPVIQMLNDTSSIIQPHSVFGDDDDDDDVKLSDPTIDEKVDGNTEKPVKEVESEQPVVDDKNRVDQSNVVNGEEIRESDRSTNNLMNNAKAAHAARMLSTGDGFPNVLYVLSNLFPNFSISYFNFHSNLPFRIFQ